MHHQHQFNPQPSLHAFIWFTRYPTKLIPTHTCWINFLVLKFVSPLWLSCSALNLIKTHFNPDFYPSEALIFPTGMSLSSFYCSLSSLFSTATSPRMYIPFSSLFSLHFCLGSLMPYSSLMFIHPFFSTEASWSLIKNPLVLFLKVSSLVSQGADFSMLIPVSDWNLDWVLLKHFWLLLGK